MLRVVSGIKVLGSTVVNHSIDNPKIEGLNPTSGTGLKKLEPKCQESFIKFGGRLR